MNRIIEMIRSRWVYALGIAVLLALVVFAVLPQAVSVEVAVVDRGTVRASLVDEGRTRMREVYVVSAPVSGRLLRVAVEAGDRVQKGEPLARMTRGASGFLDPRSDAEARAIVLPQCGQRNGSMPSSSHSSSASVLPASRSVTSASLNPASASRAGSLSPKASSSASRAAASHSPRSASRLSAKQ